MTDEFARTTIDAQSRAILELSRMQDRLRRAVLAYDDALRLAARRGLRVISDDEHLDELYVAMIRAAGRDPEK